MCLCKDAEIKKKKSRRRRKGNSAASTAVAQTCCPPCPKSSSLPFLPLKLISAIRDIDGVTLTAMLGVTSDARDKRRRRASG